MTAIPITHRKPVDAADVLRDSFRIYTEHASVVVGASIALQAIQLVLSILVLNALQVVGFFLTGAIGAVISLITTGVYTLLLLHLRWGHERPTIGYLFKSTLPWTLPLIWLSVLSTIGIFIGFLFLIIPGLILSLLWSVAAPAMICERNGALEALSRSRALVKEAWGTVVVVTIFQGAVGIGIPQIAKGMGSQMTTENLLIAQAVITAVLAPLSAIALAELYMRLSGYQPVSENTDPTGPFVPGMPMAAPLQPAGPFVPGMPAAAPAQPFGEQIAAYQQPVQPQPSPYAQPPGPAPTHADPFSQQAHTIAQPVAPVAQPAPAYTPPPAPAPQAPETTRTHSVPPPGMG